MWRKSFIFAITSMTLIVLNNAHASYVYQPMIVALKKADLVVTAQVEEIRQEGVNKWAIAQPLLIIKGQWCEDSVLRLRVRERPDTGILSSADYEILYEPETTYLLLATTKKDLVTLAHYPWISQMTINDENESIVSDVQEMISIDSMASQSTKAMRYAQLLESPHVMIRESAAWELGRLECPEALTGLIAALEDTAHWVLSNTLASLYLLGKNGITSPEAAAALERIAKYSYRIESVLRGLAAQKGNEAIPLIHNLFRFTHDPKEACLTALVLLEDSTAIPLFREAIRFDESYHLKTTALEWIRRKPEMFPDSIAFPLAITALDVENESVQASALELLRERAGKQFDPKGTKYYADEKKKKAIINKWKRWFEDWKKGRG